MLVIVRKTKLKSLTNKRCQILERYVVYPRQLLFRSEFRSQSSKNYPKIFLKNSWKIPEVFQSHLIPLTIKFRHNLLIYVYLQCVRSVSWCTTTLVAFCYLMQEASHISYRWIIMLEKCGHPDLNVFQPQMNNRRPLQLKKSKPWGLFLKLPSKKPCQFSPFTTKMGQMGWIGSAV